VPVGLFAQQQDMVLSHQIFINSKPHYYHFAEQTTYMTGEEVFAGVLTGPRLRLGLWGVSR
tara:strand:+ start:344 stop:526 length:183 start_codon:yes stop_codon:yes gene_type:complete